MLHAFYSKLSPQEKKIFYVTLAAVFLMILDRVFLGPVLSRLKVLDDEIALQRNTIQKDLRFLSYKDRMLKENDALGVYYQNKFKTTEEIIADFLKKLEIMATQSKVLLIKVSPSETVQKKGYVEYYAQLECEGLLEDIVSFMHTVDTSQDLLKILKVSMALKRATGDEVAVQMTISKMVIEVSPQETMTAASGAGGAQGVKKNTGQAGAGKGGATPFPPKKGDPNATAAPGEEVKKSIYEKIMEKTGASQSVGQGPSAQSADETEP